jgi:hypothetical protein
VSITDYDPECFDLETRVLEPFENPFGPKVLPVVTHASGLNQTAMRESRRGGRDRSLFGHSFSAVVRGDLSLTPFRQKVPGPEEGGQSLKSKEPL